MNYPIPLISFVVDKHNLTMYHHDGETTIIEQGDPRIKDLVAKLVKAKNDCDALGVPFGYLLTAEDLTGKNHYAEVEKQSNGLVRFFKMAKRKFKEIAEKFCDPVAPVSAGKIPTMRHSVTGNMVEQAIADTPTFVDPEPVKPKLPPEEERPLTKGEAAVAEIMANAVPSSDKNFAMVKGAEAVKGTEDEEELVVAVLQDNTVIHGVEQLNDQFKAVTAGVTSVDGMQKFLNRAASVERGHSVEDLLKFVQKGELPFADDGTVLVYKRLQSTNEEGVFVDCHSKKVKQRVGSFVHMAESLVDPNRNQDCSNGLHVARRDYLGSFNGDVMVLCKLAPEDVIAVPKYDARKLRAKGYFIIAQLSDEDARRLCNNQPMQDTELLANAVAGNHTPILEYVEITEQYGGGLKIKQADPSAPAEVAPVREVSSLDHVPEVNNGPVEVDARAVALGMQSGPAGGYADGDSLQVADQEQKLVGQATTDTSVVADPAPAAPIPTAPPAGFKPVNKSVSPAQKLANAYNEADLPTTKLAAARALLAFKKNAKKSWTALGIEAKVWTKAQEIVEAADNGAKNAVTKADLPAPVPPVTDTKLTEPVKKAAKPKSTGSAKAPSKQQIAKPVKAKAKSSHSVAKPATALNAPAKEKKMTQQEEMAKLVELYQNNPDKANARAIYAFKQKSKKSWEVLGVTDKKFQAKITERAKL